MSITLLEMLKSGVHFGHQSARWHPKMKQYIYTTRAGVHIIDLEKTQVKLQEAMDFARNISKEGKKILFVATKRQAKDLVKQAAESAGMPYLIERWIGGFLTNFQTVSKLMQRLRQLKRDKATGGFEKYKKHEQMEFDKEITQLEFVVGGVENMIAPPDALFVIDVKKERTAVREAKKRGVPVIAMVDTNVNPDMIDYPIPANDDATKAVALITTAIAQAINEGKGGEAKATDTPVVS